MGASAVSCGDCSADRVGDGPPEPSDIEGLSGAVEDDGDDPAVAAELPLGGGVQDGTGVEGRGAGAVFEIGQLDVHVDMGSVSTGFG